MPGGVFLKRCSKKVRGVKKSLETPGVTADLGERPKGAWHFLSLVILQTLNKKNNENAYTETLILFPGTI